MTKRTAQGGFTLVELLVAATLLTAVAVLSGQLVVQSTKLMDTTARATRNPDLVIATQWIRRDLYQAVGVIGGTSGWTDAPLVVTAQHGGWVAFALVDGELVRTDAEPGSVETETRVLLRGVLGWRWRIVGGRTLKLEFGALANPQAHENLTGAATYRVARRTERLTFALRGRPGGASW